MNRWISAAAVVLFAVAINGCESERYLWGARLDGLAVSVNRIQSLEFEASGKYFQFGQAPAPQLPWPAFDVDGYVATLDFANSAVHVKYHRVQVQEPGRLRPQAEQTMDQYAVSGITWNMAPGPTAIPANLAERNAELWTSPQGFLKAFFETAHAYTHNAVVKAQKDGGTLLTFTLEGKYRYEGEVNADGDVTRVRTFIDSPVLGDTPIESRYSDYRDFGGVKFPAHIVRTIANQPWYELTVSAVHVNSAATFALPGQIAANPAPSVAAIEVTELAPGVFNFGGGTHNSVIIEQQAGVVVVEAPLNEQRSEAVIARVRAMFPSKPITAVINTHAHFDHAGGLRTYADEGIPIIAEARNAAYYQKSWAQPRTINPDRLAKSGRHVKFRVFTGRLDLPDDTHPIEIHSILGSGHNDAFAMVYLPADKVLIEADAWTPTPPGTKPPVTPSPLWINLHDNVQRLKLDVQRVQPLHGSVQDYKELERVIAASQ